MEQKSLIIDWDDTVTLHSSPAIRDVIHQTLLDSKVSLPPEEERSRIDSVWGSPIGVMYGELLKDECDLLEDCKQIPAHKMDRIKKVHMDYMRSHYANHVELVPGSLDVLTRLKRDKDYLIGITTATDRSVISGNVFERLNVPKELFDPIISAEDLRFSGLSKPNPYTVLQIIKAHKTTPENAVLVGDSKNDVLAAKAAGVGKIVVVLTGHLEEQIAQGSLTLEDITEGLGAEVIPDFAHLETVL